MSVLSEADIRRIIREEIAAHAREQGEALDRIGSWRPFDLVDEPLDGLPQPGDLSLGPGGVVVDADEALPAFPLGGTGDGAEVVGELASIMAPTTDTDSTVSLPPVPDWFKAEVDHDVEHGDVDHIRTRITAINSLVVGAMLSGDDDAARGWVAMTKYALEGLTRTREVRRSSAVVAPHEQGDV